MYLRTRTVLTSLHFQAATNQYARECLALLRKSGTSLALGSDHANFLQSRLPLSTAASTTFSISSPVTNSTACSATAPGMPILPSLASTSYTRVPVRATMAEAGRSSTRPLGRGGRGPGRGGRGRDAAGGSRGGAGRQNFDSRGMDGFVATFQDASMDNGNGSNGGGPNLGYPPVSPGKRQRNPSSQNLSNPDGPPGPGGRTNGRRGRGGGRGGGRGEGRGGFNTQQQGGGMRGFQSGPPQHAPPNGNSMSNGDAKPNGAQSFEASRNKRNPDATPPAAQHASDMRFADIPGLTPPTLSALAREFGYEFATPVQKDTIKPALEGKDILARARTGTGKTLGFVIPAIERVCKHVPMANRKAAHVVIVSPTRELASQIAAEANVICKSHGQNFGVQLLVGGTSRPAEAKRLARGPNTFVVCTVGRFHDHAENTEGFQNILNNVKVVVLDECDRLLEMGFRQEVTKLLKILPSASSRQTLLFSATLPSQLSTLTDLALRKDHIYIDCVGEQAAETATLVVQRAAIVSKDEWLPRLSQFINEGIQQPGYKIMVFCTTARTAGFLADFFTASGMRGVSQIHSRMSQPARTKASNAFRNSNGGAIMFTSDVSARGVDYPGTTLVVQVGLPSSRDTYIHRLGRTARAGQDGQGVLLLCDYEQRFLTSTLKGLPIKDITASLPPLPADGTSQATGVKWYDTMQRTRHQLDGHDDLHLRACQAYVAWMGYMNSNLRILNWDKTRLVREASEYAGQLGLSETPIVEKKTIGKMGLKGTPGLRYT